MKKKIISGIELFSGLDADQISKIEKIAVEKNFDKDEIIFSEGEEGTGFFVIIKGAVKVFKLLFSGKEQILYIFNKGESFGEATAFMNLPCPATAQAIKKSDIILFPKKEFMALAQNDSMFSINMLAMLSVRLKQLTNKIEGLSLKEVPGRLASYLIYTAEKQNSPTKITLNISKLQLASILGAVPETLSRVFSKMSDKGIINVKGNNIEILDMKELERVAEEGTLRILA